MFRDGACRSVMHGGEPVPDILPPSSSAGVGRGLGARIYRPCPAAGSPFSVMCLCHARVLISPARWRAWSPAPGSTVPDWHGPFLVRPICRSSKPKASRTIPKRPRSLSSRVAGLPSLPDCWRIPHHCCGLGSPVALPLRWQRPVFRPTLHGGVSGQRVVRRHAASHRRVLSSGVLRDVSAQSGEVAVCRAIVLDLGR